jgi:MFS family permease
MKASASKPSIDILDLVEAGQPTTQERLHIHHAPSFWLAMLFMFAGVITFTSTLPTATEFSLSLGASVPFAGLTISAIPFASAFCIYPWSALLEFKGFHFCYSLSCGIQLAGGIIYAFSGLSGSPFAILGARLLLGTSAGLSSLFSLTYISRAVPPALKSWAMLAVNIAIASGYAAGYLLAAGSIALSDTTSLGESVVTNKNAAPGWIAAASYLILVIAFQVWFVEPPEEQILHVPRLKAAPISHDRVDISAVNDATDVDDASVGDDESQQASPTAAVMVAIGARVVSYVPTLALPVLILRIGLEHRLSTVSVTLCMAAIMAGSACLTLVFNTGPLRRALSDRAMLLGSLATSAAALLCLQFVLANASVHSTAAIGMIAALSVVALTANRLVNTAACAVMVKKPLTPQSVRFWTTVASFLVPIWYGAGGMLADSVPTETTIWISLALALMAATAVVCVFRKLNSGDRSLLSAQCRTDVDVNARG